MTRRTAGRGSARFRGATGAVHSAGSEANGAGDGGLNAEGADRDDGLRQESAICVDNPAVYESRCRGCAARSRVRDGVKGPSRCLRRPRLIAFRVAAWRREKGRGYCPPGWYGKPIGRRQRLFVDHHHPDGTHPDRHRERL